MPSSERHRELLERLRGRQPTHANGRRLRVLLVNGDARVRSHVAKTMGPTAEVHAAASVDEARRALLDASHSPFDLVIVERPRDDRPFVDRTPDARRTSPAPTARRHASRLTSRRSLPDARIEHLLVYIAEHLDQPLTLEGLAGIASVSPSHLSRTFHRVVGVPLRTYVRILRLERATALLRTSPDLSLTTVAIEAGFYDLPHFDKIFRKQFGISPSELKRRHHVVRL